MNLSFLHLQMRIRDWNSYRASFGALSPALLYFSYRNTCKCRYTKFGSLLCIHKHVCSTNSGVENIILWSYNYCCLFEFITSYHQKIDWRKHSIEQFSVLHSVPFGFYYYWYIDWLKICGVGPTKVVSAPQLQFVKRLLCFLCK